MTLVACPLGNNWILVEIILLPYRQASKGFLVFMYFGCRGAKGFNNYQIFHQTGHYIYMQTVAVHWLCCQNHQS